MNLTKEQLEAVESMGYLLLAPSYCSINLEVDDTDFVLALRDPSSAVYKAYYRGYIRQLVETRQAIIKAAHNGSNPALEQLMGFIVDVNQHLKYE
ncbi:MAG: hypothetical protein Q4A54_05850 [Parabacteroides sp.]|nr:hypothetical protein [Parabacteroides sp.]